MRNIFKPVTCKMRNVMSICSQPPLHKLFIPLVTQKCFIVRYVLSLTGTLCSHIITLPIRLDFIVFSLIGFIKHLQSWQADTLQTTKEIKVIAFDCVSHFSELLRL